MIFTLRGAEIGRVPLVTEAAVPRLSFGFVFGKIFRRMVSVS